MKIDFWDIPWEYASGNQICSAGTPVMVFTIDIQFDTPHVDFRKLWTVIEEDYLDTPEFQENIELYKTYFLLSDDDLNFFGVFTDYGDDEERRMFCDAAEHDERVIIKCGFPHRQCHIIGE